MEKNKTHTSKTKPETNILAILTGGTSASASMISDTTEANAVFDAAREANSRFSEMTNDEIVDYCNSLNYDQLRGMVNLIHGRYFEKIVADETGSVLFEAKNNPDTDMLLNGTEYSIKSNDTTADSITEFETYSPQNFDLDDKELRERTAEILDDDIIDTTDAILSGAVGFGTIATIKSIGEGLEEWDNLKDYQKNEFKATVIGTKAAGRAAIQTVKSSWKLLKTAVAVIPYASAKATELSREYLDKDSNLRRFIEEHDAAINERNLAKSFKRSFVNYDRGIKDAMDYGTSLGVKTFASAKEMFEYEDSIEKLEHDALIMGVKLSRFDVKYAKMPEDEKRAYIEAEIAKLDKKK